MPLSNLLKRRTRIGSRPCPALPSHGFFIRHAKNVQLNNIEVVYAKEDLRPAFVVQDVKGIEFFRVKAQRASEGATFALKGVTDFSISQSRPLADTLLESVAEKKI